MIAMPDAGTRHAHFSKWRTHTLRAIPIFPFCERTNTAMGLPSTNTSSIEGTKTDTRAGSAENPTRKSTASQVFRNSNAKVYRHANWPRQRQAANILHTTATTGDEGNKQCRHSLFHLSREPIWFRHVARQEKAAGQEKIRHGHIAQEGMEKLKGKPGKRLNRRRSSNMYEHHQHLTTKGHVGHFGREVSIHMNHRNAPKSCRFGICPTPKQQGMKVNSVQKPSLTIAFMVSRKCLEHFSNRTQTPIGKNITHRGPSRDRYGNLIMSQHRRKTPAGRVGNEWHYSWKIGKGEFR